MNINNFNIWPRKYILFIMYMCANWSSDNTCMEAKWERHVSCSMTFTYSLEIGCVIELGTQMTVREPQWPSCFRKYPHPTFYMGSGDSNFRSLYLCAQHSCPVKTLSQPHDCGNCKDFSKLKIPKRGKGDCILYHSGALLSKLTVLSLILKL